MCQVLNKNTINLEIIPHNSLRKKSCKNEFFIFFVYAKNRTFDTTS